MARSIERKAEGNRAAIYARVSDKSQDTEEKTSISEQIADMEAHCERMGLTIVARYQEVGRGWTKKRPEFQRMLADARAGRFDVIVCWKSDRLSRGMHPAAALLEVVEARQIRLEAVMDSIDMAIFGLMAAVGKMELDNFRERASMGKRGKAKQGRMPNGSVPYGYRTGGRRQAGDTRAGGRGGEAHLSAVRSRRNGGHGDYTAAGTGTTLPCGDRVPSGTTPTSALYWGRRSTRDPGGTARPAGLRQRAETKCSSSRRIRGSKFPSRRWWTSRPGTGLRPSRRSGPRLSKRNTKIFYLLQHLLRCAECGLLFSCRSKTRRTVKRNDKTYSYNYNTPQRHYHCYGMQRDRLQCRERPYIRADRLEELVWSEVKKVVQNPDLIRESIESLDTQEDGGLAKRIAGADRELR